MATVTEATTPDKNAPLDTANQTPLTGRSVFMVETVAAGVAVRPAFLTEDGRLLDLPAVFPDQTYAMAQIDELRRLVNAHFAQAAQVGAQVIAAQAAANPPGAAATSTAGNAGTAVDASGAPTATDSASGQKSAGKS